MEHVEVRTQHELDEALERDVVPVCVGGEGFKAVGANLVARDSSRVAAWGSSRVVAAGSSVVVARDGSRVEAWESARVVARGASTVVANDSTKVVAWEPSRVVAQDSSTVVAAKLVAVHRSNGPRDRATVDGGVVIDVHQPTTPTDWCDYHGVPIRDGLVTLFKAVDDDFRSDHGVAYVPGTQPAAPDWDGGAGECGGG